MLYRLWFSPQAGYQERARGGSHRLAVHAELAEGLSLPPVALRDPEGEYGQVGGNGQPVGLRRTGESHQGGRVVGDDGAAPLHQSVCSHNLASGQRQLRNLAHQDIHPQVDRGTQKLLGLSWRAWASSALVSRMSATMRRCPSPARCFTASCAIWAKSVSTPGAPTVQPEDPMRTVGIFSSRSIASRSSP